MAKLPYIIPYDPFFLGDGFQVPLPNPSCTDQLVNDGTPLDYIYYSLVMYRDKKTAIYTAHNIDMSLKKTVKRKDNWALDKRISADWQVPKSAYANNPYDKGHLVRRDAVAWGKTIEEAQAASEASFYLTNSTFQLDRFNRNREKWLGLEDWIMQRAGAIGTRLCVFTGPIFTNVDVSWQTYRIPSAFWKIVVLRDPASEGQTLSAVAFLMKQNPLWGAATRRLLDPAPYQVPIAAIEAYTGLQFVGIQQVDEFQYQIPRTRSVTPQLGIPINGPEDIFFASVLRQNNLPAKPASRSSSSPSIDTTEIFISALCPNPAGRDAGKEWIEITNNNDSVIDLSDYYLLDQQRGRVQLEGTLSGKSAIKITLSSDSKIKLSNKGDEIRLLKGAILIHLAIYQNAKSEEVLTFDPLPNWDPTAPFLMGLIPGAERC